MAEEERKRPFIHNKSTYCLQHSFVYLKCKLSILYIHDIFFICVNRIFPVSLLSMKPGRFYMKIALDVDKVSISFSINSITVFFAICGKFSFTDVRILVSLEILLNDTMFLNRYEISVQIITVAQLNMEGRVCFLFQKLSLINHTTLYKNQRNNFTICTLYTLHIQLRDFLCRSNKVLCCPLIHPTVYHFSFHFFPISSLQNLRISKLTFSV